jgi:hypothetical protein
MNGGLAQTINEPFFGTYYELWDMDQDGRPEIVLLPSNPADNPELFMHVYKWTTTLDAGASGALGAPSLSLLGANPARGSSTFSYSLPTASNAEVVVYDLQGRAVRTLARGPAKAGVHQATWDGEDRDGRKVPSGQYYVQFSSNGTSLGRKIICLR